MFIVNGEPLHQKTHPEEYKWMQSKFKEIRESGKKNYSFAAFRKRAMYLREDGRMVPQKTRYRRVSVTGHTEEPTGMRQTWTYAASYNALDGDDSGRYKPKKGTMALEFDTTFDVQRDIELIFFFMYLSGNRHVRHIDHEANRRNQVKETALQVKASNLIYNEESPIHPDKTGSEDKIRNVALSWGVSNAMKMDKYDLMHELWNKVQSSEQNKRNTKRGYKEFIEEVNKYSNIESRANVIKAIEKGYLIYSNNIWVLKTAGGAEDFLCGVPRSDEQNKDEYVLKYVLDNQYVYEVLLAALEEPLPEPEEKPINLDPKKRHELLADAKKLGWTGPLYREISKMKKEELEELVEEGRKPLVNE